jgi:hypothetical protein
MNTDDIMAVALDLAQLSNVPSDSAVHVPSDNVRKLYATIDCDVADLLLARELKCDLVLTHHPEGASTVYGWPLIRRQIDQMAEVGVPIARAEAAVQRRIRSVELASHGRNYGRVVQAAQLLKMPLLNVHLPCDIVTRRLIAEKMTPFAHSDHRATVAAVIEALQEFPEHQRALTEPKIALGGPDRFAGRVAVAMGGYTSGGVEVLQAYFEAGVGTVLSMHFPEADIREARERKLAGNLVLTGHMGSDSIGVNVFLDELERLGLKVVRGGGIVAVR